MLSIADNIDFIHKSSPVKSITEGSKLAVESNPQSIDAIGGNTFVPNYEDKLEISEEYKVIFQTENKQAEKENNKDVAGEAEKPKPISGKDIKPEDEKLIKELEKRDQEVRKHEEAHKAAGGGLVKGAASYNYTLGPDGKQYAIGGEVKIDMTPIDGDPEATIQKMQLVKRAALAPTDPSSQDISVAHAAASIEAEAKSELTKSKTSNKTSNGEAPGAGVINKPNISDASTKVSSGVAVNNTLKKISKN